jgi:hypothetical protein
LTNLGAMRLHLGDDIGFGCVGIVLEVLSDLFSAFRQSGVELLFLLAV